MQSAGPAQLLPDDRDLLGPWLQHGPDAADLEAALHHLRPRVWAHRLREVACAIAVEPCSWPAVLDDIEQRRLAGRIIAQAIGRRLLPLPEALVDRHGQGLGLFSAVLGWPGGLSRSADGWRQMGLLPAATDDITFTPAERAGACARHVVAELHAGNGAAARQWFDAAKQERRDWLQRGLLLLADMIEHAPARAVEGSQQLSGEPTLTAADIRAATSLRQTASRLWLRGRLVQKLEPRLTVKALAKAAERGRLSYIARRGVNLYNLAELWGGQYEPGFDQAEADGRLRERVAEALGCSQDCLLDPDPALIRRRERRQGATKAATAAT